MPEFQNVPASQIGARLQAFIKAARMVDQLKPLPEAIEVPDGERFDVHTLLQTYSHPERFPQPAPAELTEAAGGLASFFANPTIGDVGEQVFLTAERRMLFHHMRPGASQTRTPGAFQTAYSETRTEARGPEREPPSRELMGKREEIQAKKAVGVKPIRGTTLAVLNACGRRVIQEEPLPPT